jgi:3-hydroxybutyryl-CoA dehydratase
VTMSELRQKAVRGLKPGDTFTCTRTFSRAETEAFGELTRDYNPVHYDENFARVLGFNGVINHGLLTAGLLCEIGGQLGWLATMMAFEFRLPVYAGDTVTCRVVVESVDERGHATATVAAQNDNGDMVVVGSLEGKIPSGASREVLAAMVDEGDPTNPLT